MTFVSDKENFLLLFLNVFSEENYAYGTGLTFIVLRDQHWSVKCTGEWRSMSCSGHCVFTW